MLGENITDERFSLVEKSNVLTTIAKMKANPNYQEAKAGNVEKAADLIDKLITPKHEAKIREILSKHPDAVLVPIRAKEQKGDNSIPTTLAKVMNRISGNEISYDIKQANKTHHTDATHIERFFSYPKFNGEVKTGKTYILVDDASTQGSTLKSLKDYIESNGGDVVECVVMGIGRGGNLLEEKNTELQQKIISKFGEKELNLLLNETGRKNIDNLTTRELQFLEHFDSVDGIRNASAGRELEKNGRIPQQTLGDQTPISRQDNLESRIEQIPDQFFRTPQGTIYGFVKDGVVYLNSDVLNTNSPIHEFGHENNSRNGELNSKVNRGSYFPLLTLGEIINDKNLRLKIKFVIN